MVVTPAVVVVVGAVSLVVVWADEVVVVAPSEVVGEFAEVVGEPESAQAARTIVRARTGGRSRRMIHRG